MKKKVIIVGAGFTGMAAAAFLAHSGYDVEIFEKLDTPGGRLRQFSSGRLQFNTGPQFIMLPEIIKDFFNKFNRQLSTYVQLKKLDPLVRFYYRDTEEYDVPSDSKELDEYFEKYLKNGARKKARYLGKAGRIHDDLLIGGHLHSDKFPPDSFISRIFGAGHLNFVKKLFRDHHIADLLELHHVFLGHVPAWPSALCYAFNFSMLKYGFLCPVGGMFQLAKAMIELLDELQVPVHVSSPVESYDVIDNKVSGIITHGKSFHADYFIAATDYHASEQLLPPEFRNYGESDWEFDDTTTASFIFYLGLGKKMKDLSPNSVIINSPEYGLNLNMTKSHTSLDIPMLLVSCPTGLNPQLTPPGKDIVVFRCVLQSGIEDTGKTREHYFEKAVGLFEQACKQEIRNHILYKKTQAQSDFNAEFGTLEGKAFGWISEAYLKGKQNKKMQNTKVGNLFYAEYPVFAGTGIASSLLTGELVAGELLKYNERHSG